MGVQCALSDFHSFGVVVQLSKIHNWSVDKNVPNIIQQQVDEIVKTPEDRSQEEKCRLKNRLFYCRLLYIFIHSFCSTIIIIYIKYDVTLLKHNQLKVFVLHPV